MADQITSQTRGTLRIKYERKSYAHKTAKQTRPMDSDALIPKTKRPFSGKARYHKIDMARGQLDTAIRLFLVDGGDICSAITLAGAAGELLDQLVLRAGRKTLADTVVTMTEFHIPGKTPARNSVIKHIHDVLHINRLKHFDKDEAEIVDFDAEQCALAAILKAIADYKRLTGEQSQAMAAFMTWTSLNLDLVKIKEKWDNAPEKLTKVLKADEALQKLSNNKRVK
jgi:hypothetical protein